MPIDLDNISFYSHPPTKTASATPTSCWRPYQASINPHTIPFIPPTAQIQPSTRETLAPNAGSDFDLEIGRAMSQNRLAMHDVTHTMHFDSGFQSEIETPQSEDSSLTMGILDLLPDHEKARLTDIVYHRPFRRIFLEGDVW